MGGSTPPAGMMPPGGVSGRVHDAWQMGAPHCRHSTPPVPLLALQEAHTHGCPAHAKPSPQRGCPVGRRTGCPRPGRTPSHAPAHTHTHRGGPSGPYSPNPHPPTPRNDTFTHTDARSGTPRAHPPTTLGDPTRPTHIVLWTPRNTHTTHTHTRPSHPHTPTHFPPGLPPPRPAPPAADTTQRRRNQQGAGQLHQKCQQDWQHGIHAECNPAGRPVCSTQHAYAARSQHPYATTHHSRRRRHRCRRRHSRRRRHRSRRRHHRRNRRRRNRR